MANVAIDPVVIHDWHYAGTAFTLRIFSDRSFVALDESVVPGRGDNNEFYREYTIAVAGTDAAIPAVTLASQTDAPNERNSRYSAFFYVDGVEKDMYLASSLGAFQVPATPVTTNWNALEQYNFRSNRRYYKDENTYSRVDILALIAASSAANFVDATTTQKGVGTLDVPALVPTAPQFTGSNSPVLPAFVLHTSKYASLNAAITALAALGGGTIVVDSATPVTSSVATTALMELKFEGQGMLTGTAKTVTLVGPSPFDMPGRAPAKQLFASGVTISLAGSLKAWYAHTDWFGAAGDDSTANAVALNKCSNTLVSANASGFGNGVIQAGPGIYHIESQWTVGSTTGGGDDLGAFTGISILGTNGSIGTCLKWTGSTSGKMLKIARDRYGMISGIKFDSAVALGSTIGLWLSGPPNLGEQTSNMIIALCEFTNLHVGVQAGDVGGGNQSAAGELTFQNVIFQSCDTGYLGASSGNSLVIRFNNCSGYDNNNFAINIGAGSGDTHVVGGGFSNNAGYDIGLSLGWNGTVNISDARFEVKATATGSIATFGNTGMLRMSNCRWRAKTTVPTFAMVQGVAFLQMDSCFLGIDADVGWIAASGANLGKGNLSFKNNCIQNTTIAGLFTLETATTGQVGMTYQAEGNFYTSSGVIVRYNNILAGVVGQNDVGDVIRIAQSKVVNGVLTGDTLTFGNQVATPSVAYGGGNVSYKTSDTGATVQTDMLGGQDGQIVTIWFVNGGRTIQDNANQQLAGNADFVGSANDILTLKRINGVWYEQSRSVN